METVTGSALCSPLCLISVLLSANLLYKTGRALKNSAQSILSTNSARLLIRNAALGINPGKHSPVCKEGLPIVAEVIITTRESTPSHNITE